MFKRIASLLLIIGCVFAFSACGPKGNSSEYIDILTSDSFTLSYDTDDAATGMASSFDHYMDGENFAIKVTIDSLSMHVITKDGKSYFLNEAQKVYAPITSPIDAASISINVDDFKNLELKDSGKEEVNGVNCTYDEYSFTGDDGEEKTLRFYMEGEKLYAISRPENSAILVIKELKAGVPDGIFDIPADYQETTSERLLNNQGAEETETTPEDTAAETDDGATGTE